MQCIRTGSFQWTESQQHRLWKSADRKRLVRRLMCILYVFNDLRAQITKRCVSKFKIAVGSKKTVSPHKKSDQPPFPRGRSLPLQSPLFWVQQKDRYVRQLLIRDIEERSGRRLVCYFANRYSPAADLNIGDVSQLTELLSDIDGEPVDLLLNTNGGQTDATEALISLIHARTSDFRVVVPHSAKSNGTMLCLAGNEIVMGAPSELGPIDPYLGDTPASILAEGVVKDQNFALHKLALYAIEQTKSLARRLLTEGMMADCTEEVIEETVKNLSSRDKFFSHGSAIDHVQAKSLGLNVRYLEVGDPYWDRIWLLYCMYAHDVVRDGLLKVFEGRALSMALSPSPTKPLNHHLHPFLRPYPKHPLVPLNLVRRPHGLVRIVA